MKKYSILALALVLCVTGLTGCRRNRGLADGTIPSTTETTAATTHPTTMPATAATTHPAATDVPASDSTMDTQDGMTDATAPAGKSRSAVRAPGVG